MRKFLFVVPFLAFLCCTDAPQAEARHRAGAGGCGAGRGGRLLHPFQGVRERRSEKRGSSGACATGECAAVEAAPVVLPKNSNKVPVKK